MYKSLFDMVDPSLFYQKPPIQMSFNGTLDDVLHILEESKISSENGVLNRLFMAPRLSRHAIDFLVTKKRGLRLVQESLHFLKLAYTHDDVSSNITQYRDVLQSFGVNPSTEVVSQQSDDMSWESLNPEMTRKTVSKLSNKGPLCIVSLAHGSVGLGMDVFLRLNNLNPFTEYSFHALRLSRTKSYQDKSLCLKTLAEKRYLENISSGKSVVIFDEDSNTGNTLHLAESEFSTYFPDTIVSGLANNVYFSSKFKNQVEYNNC